MKRIVYYFELNGPTSSIDRKFIRKMRIVRNSSSKLLGGLIPELNSSGNVTHHSFSYQSVSIYLINCNLGT